MEIAGLFRRVFVGNPDGERVLQQLRVNFNPRVPRFIKAAPGTKPEFDPNPTAAAFRDGQASVILEIEDAIEQGAIMVSPTNPTPTPK